MLIKPALSFHGMQTPVCTAPCCWEPMLCWGRRFAAQLDLTAEHLFACSVLSQEKFANAAEFDDYRLSTFARHLKEQQVQYGGIACPQHASRQLRATCKKDLPMLL